MKTRTYQVKDVAGIAGVSTRTLRHYDQLGLLVPSTRSEAGYRLYNDADLLRLQQILIGRALGLALEDIRKLIDAPEADRKRLLQQQREALTAQAQATAAMIHSIDAAIALLDANPLLEVPMMNMKQIFNGFDPAQYEHEVQERWGNTDKYKESIRRTRGYSAEDWRQMKQTMTSIMTDAVVAMRANIQPDDSRVMDIAERHRLEIDRWFYSCSPSMHVLLAEGYEMDERFARHFNSFAAGLTPFLSAAIRANSKRKPESFADDPTENFKASHRESEE